MITANYICKTEEDFEDLMKYLEDNGVLWNSNTKPTGWGVFDKDRVYCIKDNVMTYNDSYPRVPNVQEWIRGGSKQDLDENSRKEYKTTDLKDKKIVYTFDTEEDYIDLMRYLEDNGAKWVSGQKPTEFSPLSLKPYHNKHNDIEIELESNVLLWNHKSRSNQIYPGRKDFEYVHWRRSKAENSEQGLAEFLGWEEDVVYEGDEWIYKVEDGILKSKIKNEEMDWVHDNMSINKYAELRNLKRHNPCYMIRTIFEDDNGIQYLTKNGPKVFLASKSENKDLQTFTEADAKDLIKKYNLQDIAALIKVS